MSKITKHFSNWDQLRVGITGASGALGRALTKELKDKGAFVIGFTTKDISKQKPSEYSPHKWVNWECGQESLLDSTLITLDIIILNHGINKQGVSGNKDINMALEVNAISSWRIIERFEYLSEKDINNSKYKEIWVNTSEAEIQPALSPLYEISKRLLGQIVSIKMASINKSPQKSLKIRKLILGPFKSDLNPIGIMDAEIVAKQILNLAKLRIDLIIISPNPITYITMPITELLRYIYLKFTLRIKH